ncbi:hypothetical protein D3C85_1119100 [compost metagenome]
MVFQPGCLAIAVCPWWRRCDSLTTTALARERTVNPSAVVHDGGGVRCGRRRVDCVVALAADSRRPGAVRPEQPAVPDQQDQPLACASAALSGAGLRHRQIASRYGLDAELAGTAKLSHGALLAGDFLSGRVARTFGGHAQRPDRRRLRHANLHGAGGCRVDGVAGGVAGVQQAFEPDK